MTASSLLEALSWAEHAAQIDPASSHAWAPWQKRFLGDRSTRRVLRAANRIGKTFVLAADIAHDIRGTNPYRPRRRAGPSNALFVGESIQQMSRPGGPIETIWHMLPRHEIDPAVRYVRGKGLRGLKDPAIPIVRGPGAGSVIMFGTYRQSAAVYAGFSADRVDCDEPTPEHIYAELSPRIFDRGGTFTIGFTPVIGMPDQTWLRKLVDGGIFHEHWIPLEEEAFRLEGHAVPRISQARIDELIAGWPEIERGLRARAEWEAVILDRYLSAFQAGKAVRPFYPPAGATVIVGIDHGLKPGKQAAVLVVVENRESRERARVWFLDEVQGTGQSTPTDDARAILAMLDRHGLTYDDVDEWVGDRSTGDGLILHSKSNGDLRKAIAIELGRGSKDARLKWINTPSKWHGSVEHGLFLLNAMFGEGRAIVHPRCKRFAEACEKFRGGKYDEHKDVLDAGRYAVERALATGPKARVVGSKWVPPGL